MLLLPCSLFAQTRNYDQELTNLLFANQIEEANSYYNQYKDSIFHPFVRDSYQLIASIHAGDLESVLAHFPVFIENYYGDLLQDDLLFYLPSLYVNDDKYASGLKMLDSIETFFKRRQSEGIDSEKALKETKKQKQQYMVWSRFPQWEWEYSSPDFVLVDLLFKKRIVEAQEYYALHKDIAHPFALDSHRLITAIYADKPDSVLSLLSAFIDKYYGTLIHDDVLLHLPSFYWDLGEYDNGLKMLDSIDTFFRRKQDGEDEKERITAEISKLKHRYTTYNLLPKFEINVPENTEKIQVSIQTEPLILFDAQYNQTTLSTVFDTGSPHPFFTRKDVAEKAGIRIIEPYTKQLFDEREVNLAYGIIDSIRVGSLLIRNALVTIMEEGYFTNCVPDSVQDREEALAKHDSISNLLDVIVGLPAMTALNYIQLDFPNSTLSFSPNRKKEIVPETKSNMLIESGSLYLQTEINGLNFTAFMDTGGNLEETAILIDEQFYKNHAEQFPSAYSHKKEIKDLCRMPGYNTLTFFKSDSSIIMRLGDNVVDLTDKTIITVSESASFPYDREGYAALGLFKKMGKVTFDFDAMRMGCE